MLNFQNDYHDIAHPKVIDKLMGTKDPVPNSYGNDVYAKEAKSLLANLFGTDDFYLQFVHGGTMANIIGLTSVLRSYEAIIAPRTGHIVVHETGAMELRGHRVITIDSDDGKLYPNQIQEVVDAHGDEFNVLPRIVCIANTTEYGGVYLKDELAALKKVCEANNLLLYIDGARLGSALASPICDYTWKDLASLCDGLSIGGTKNGALFGEAIVLFHPVMSDHLRFYLKSTGGMLAKGFLMSLQYIALFEDGVYMDNAKHANDMGQLLYNNLKDSNVVQFAGEVESNQIFIYGSDELSSKLDGKVIYEKMPWLDGKEVFRFVMTYTTSEEEIQLLTQVMEG